MQKMFRYKKGSKTSYNKQGYIFFISKCYTNLEVNKQKIILNLCILHGGEHWKALFEYITTDTSAEEIAQRHGITKPILYTMMWKYYDSFPDWI